MNITIETRMDSIEQQLKELRKEMEDSIARYNAYGKSYPFTHGDISKFRSGQIGDTEEPVGFIPMTSLKVLKSKYKEEESKTRQAFDQAREELKAMVLKNFSATC